MDDNHFWPLIETAWQAAGGQHAFRQKLAEGKLSAEEAEELVESLALVIPALREELSDLPQEELMAFDRILERKLYEIDRAEIQRCTDGSDDGFLYARGFIVAAGQQYYEAVKARPATAMMDLECEVMCYLSWHLYREKFGKMPPSDISRESCSNSAGWADPD